MRDGSLPVRWNLAALLADQAVHISVLIALVAMAQSSGWIGDSTFWTTLFGCTWGNTSANWNVRLFFCSS